MNKSQLLFDYNTLNNIRIQLKRDSIHKDSLILFMRISYGIKQNYKLDTTNQLVKKQHILENRKGISKLLPKGFNSNGFPYMYETTNQKYLKINQTNLLTVVNQTLEQLEQLK